MNQLAAGEPAYMRQVTLCDAPEPRLSWRGSFEP